MESFEFLEILISISSHLPIDSQRFDELIKAHKVRQYVGEPTHDQGGLLDVVLAAEDGAPTDITVVESGLSDHHPIHWTISVAHPLLPYSKLRRRTWKDFSLKAFVKRVEHSPLCQPVDPNKTATNLALCFQSVRTTILDELKPVTEVAVRPFLHCPFYDAECWQAH